MDMNTQIKPAKATEFSGTDAPRAFREMAEKGTAQANESYEKINAATAESADLVKSSYSAAARGMQEYNNKVIEFAQANTNGAFDFVQKLSGVKSPPAFIELWTEHLRKQVEMMVEQTQQLAAIAQKMMHAPQPGRPS